MFVAQSEKWEPVFGKIARQIKMIAPHPGSIRTDEALEQRKATQHSAMAMSIDEIIDNFEFMDDWEDRYRYVIELGKELEPLQPDDYTEDHKVRGCVSQVWLVTERGGDAERPVLKFRGDSDAHIVRGLIAILIALYSGKRAEEITQLDAEKVFDQIGLRDHLTPQRSNGLASMVQRVKQDAAAAQSTATA